MRNIKLGLSPDQVAARRLTFGGSDANILMNGDPAAIQALWEVKTGKAEPEDLSRILPVQLGSWTEEFNRYWFETQTGRQVTDEGARHINGFRACNLDGMTTTEGGQSAVFEAKHVNGFSKMDEVTQRYMPQLHHNSWLAGTNYAVLSVLLGTQGWECVEVPIDEWYMCALIDQETQFWQCVETDTPPLGFEPIKAPVAPEKFRKVDFTGNNEWGALAADWLSNRGAAKKFETAVKGIKGLVEPDVGHAVGHGIEAKRSKAGALTIKEVA